MTWELRKHYFLDVWVAYSTVRARRPKDFAKGREPPARRGPCPFCPGNEDMTPPAVLLYLRREGELIKARDGTVRPKDWLVRVVPNKYPAFVPDARKPGPEAWREAARGHHWVCLLYTSPSPRDRG